MTDISGSRESACRYESSSTPGSSTATTAGRSRRILCRTSMANSIRPGTTGRYVRLPRQRLPASFAGWSADGYIAQCFFAQRFDYRRAQHEPQIAPAVVGAQQLGGKARDVDAVAHRVALLAGMRLLQKIGDVVQDLLVAEGQVFLENRVLLVPLRKLDDDLRLQAGVDVF